MSEKESFITSTLVRDNSISEKKIKDIKKKISAELNIPKKDINEGRTKSYSLPACIIPKDKLVKLELAYSLGASDVEAALFADIPKSHIYKYINKYPEFAERRAILRETMVLKAKNLINEALDGKHGEQYIVPTAKWLLERRSPDFANSMNISGPNGGSLIFENAKININNINQIREAIGLKITGNDDKNVSNIVDEYEECEVVESIVNGN